MKGGRTSQVPCGLFENRIDGAAGHEAILVGMAAWDSLERELDIAIRAAKKAAELAIQLQAGIVAEKKSDDSPVTQADRDCEKLVAAILTEAFPDDGLLGEEGANCESRSGRRWIIDPIDGTRDYVRGIPLWANLIALESHDDVVLGVVHLPMFGNLYTATRGGGAFRNSAPIQVSSKTSIQEAVLCFNGLNKLNGLRSRAGLLEWIAQFWSVRALGGAADAMMVAAGEADLWVEPSACAWDFAPLKVIVEEAGGSYFNLDGGSSIYAGNAVVCAPGLEAESKRFLTSLS
jgi:histidinol phosphatase-like enzyme (inositol monophosphatase family)